MEFTVLNKNFSKLLQLLNSLLSSKTILPVLNNILFYVKDHSIFIRGTDLEIEVFLKIDSRFSTNETSESFMVSLKRLINIFKNLPQNLSTNLKLIKEKLIIDCENIHYSIPTSLSNDFPVLDQYKFKEEVEISQFDLKKIIESTYFSMSNQDIRYYLNGMYFELDDQEIRTVTTDGYRLATSLIRNQKKNRSNSFIVSKKGIMSMIKVLNNKIENIKLQIGSSNIKLITKKCILIAKLIGGQFPNYQKLILQKYNKFAKINFNEFKESIFRANVLAYDNIKGVELKFKNNKLCITVHNPDKGIFEEALDLSYYGDNLNINFNIKYIIDVLNHMSCKKLKLSFIDKISSMKIEDYEDQNNTYLIMPIRI